MSKSVIVTGSSGGIGQALIKIFKEAGYKTIGIDKSHDSISFSPDIFFEMDLARFASDIVYAREQRKQLEEHIHDLKALINNAAIQILGASEVISDEEWDMTIATNLTAPFKLSQWTIPYLEKNNGIIINVGSIHQTLTKREFVAYATSKSALIGLTKAMAVDLNGRVRVNAISPAAIETEMLRAGFNYNQNALDKLRKLHPSQCIGNTEEVAKVALFLLEGPNFMNGANITLDGGISSVLNDI